MYYWKINLTRLFTVLNRINKVFLKKTRFLTNDSLTWLWSIIIWSLQQQKSVLFKAFSVPENWRLYVGKGFCIFWAKNKTNKHSHKNVLVFGTGSLIHSYIYIYIFLAYFEYKSTHLKRIQETASYVLVYFILCL